MLPPVFRSSEPDLHLQAMEWCFFHPFAWALFRVMKAGCLEGQAAVCVPQVFHWSARTPVSAFNCIPINTATEINWAFLRWCVHTIHTIDINPAHHGPTSPLTTINPFFNNNNNNNNNNNKNNSFIQLYQQVF